MATFLFTYRVPHGYTPGRPEMVAAWRAWFESLDTSVLEQGLPVVASTPLGNCGADTRLGGYSLVSADDLETALAMARGCPALDLTGGVEVGVTRELHLIIGAPDVSARDGARATAS